MSIGYSGHSNTYCTVCSSRLQHGQIPLFDRSTRCLLSSREGQKPDFNWERVRLVFFGSCSSAGYLAGAGAASTPIAPLSSMKFTSAVEWNSLLAAAASTTVPSSSVGVSLPTVSTYKGRAIKLLIKHIFFI